MVRDNLMPQEIIAKLKIKPTATKYHQINNEIKYQVNNTILDKQLIEII